MVFQEYLDHKEQQGNLVFLDSPVLKELWDHKVEPDLMDYPVLPVPQELLESLDQLALPVRLDLLDLLDQMELPELKDQKEKSEFPDLEAFKESLVLKDHQELWEHKEQPE